MEWLETALNDRGIWAILVKREDWTGTLEGTASKKVTSCLRLSDLDQEAIKRELAAYVKAGRLIMLFDALDQVRFTEETFSFCHKPPPPWDECGFILAGRPHPFWASWTEDSDSSAIKEQDWRFVEPAVFTDEQARRYLDSDGNSRRYRFARQQLGPLCNVPRVLRYLRELSENEIKRLRTSAGLYDGVVQKLLPQLAKSLFPSRNRKKKRESQRRAVVLRLGRLLSALAFVSWNRPRDSARDKVIQQRGTNLHDITSLDLDKDVRSSVLSRMTAEYPGYDPDSLESDLQILSQRLGLIISGHSLEGATVIRIEWSNRTIVEFLTAEWLSRHAVISDRSSAVATSIESRDQVSQDAMSFDIFYPEGLDSATYELNLFLAEFPRPTPSIWLGCARRWYDPQDGCSRRRWSAEMLYRSWKTMHKIAGRPVHDWWNTSYHRLSARRAELVQRDDHSGLAPTPETAQRARDVLDRFLGDFQRIIDHGDDEQKRAARELIDNDGWCHAKAGTFEMGALERQQGFPVKLKSFWERELDAVQTGKVHRELRHTGDNARPCFRKAQAGEDQRKVAVRAATWLTKKEWFTGLTGKQLRQDDVKWLARILGGGHDDDGKKVPGIARRARRNRNAPDYRHAYKEIERKWRKRDEIPRERSQAVAAFSIHRFPVLHRWFWLFSPGHLTSVENYLRDVSNRYPHPPEYHPVIYVSWFDAWAFCQWATWRVDASDRVYKLRLPHEPEWEYAVRWNRKKGAQPVQTGRKDRYWWGNRFYATEKVPEDRRPGKGYEKMAHVDGRPGHTGAPSALTPNGLGLYDTLGNVWEWMANIYDMRSENELTKANADPVQYSRHMPHFDGQPPVNAQRSMRGGLWYYLDLLATCTSRYRLAADDDRDYKMGFRVVREEWKGDTRLPASGHTKELSTEQIQSFRHSLETEFLGDKIRAANNRPTIPQPDDVAGKAAIQLDGVAGKEKAPRRKHRILFLAADPWRTEKRALDDEARAIEYELNSTTHRRDFKFVSRWAVQPLDLLRTLRKLKPTVVHFSGRGDDSTNGLYFQSPEGGWKLVSADSLRETFSAAGPSVRVIVLSACHSKDQAEVLTKCVDCVVGTSGGICGDAAKSFAIGFYGALGEHDSIRSAFSQGCAAIGLNGKDGADRLHLKVRDGVDANQITLTAMTSG